MFEVDPSLVCVFERKDYASGRVPIDDVEEFHAKLEQIGQDRTKGTIITNGALEGSAVDYARSKGVGLIRLLPDDQIEILMSYLTAASMRRSTWNSSEVIPALTNPAHRSERSFFAISDGQLFGSWYSMLAMSWSEMTRKPLQRAGHGRYGGCLRPHCAVSAQSLMLFLGRQGYHYDRR